MIDSDVRFRIETFIKENYFEKSSNQYILQETQVTNGILPTSLEVNVSGDNLCLKNYDKKGRSLFLLDKKGMNLTKCVDHVILQYIDKIWIMHLLEFKNRVDNAKWRGIREKNLASYLNVKALSAVLGIEISEVRTYTIYRKDEFRNHSNKTNPRMMVAPLGRRYIDPVEEWQSGKMFVQLIKDDKTWWPHKALQVHDDQGVLKGCLTI